LNRPVRVVQRNDDQLDDVFIDPQVDKLANLADQFGAPFGVSQCRPLINQPLNTFLHNHCCDTNLEIALLVRRNGLRDGAHGRRIRRRAQLSNCF
jgi:hypothetical protein